MVVVVLDDLFGLLVTSGGVGVLEGRYFAPGVALCRPHYPLESLMEVGGAVAIPGGEYVRKHTSQLVLQTTVDKSGVERSSL